MSILKIFPEKDSLDIYDLFFRIGMWWRIFYGFLRLILGLTLLHLVGTPLSNIFFTIMRQELIEDPNDFFIRTISPLIQQTSLEVTYFLAVYLIFWAITDVSLSISLLKHKMWAFPVSMSLIGIFVLYEMYRFSYTHSFVLAWVIIIDLILVWLIRKEYLKLKSLHQTGSNVVN